MFRVISGNKLSSKNEGWFLLSLAKLHDLVETYIRDPGVALLVNLQSMRHVKQTRSKTRFDFPFVCVNCQNCVFVDDLSDKYKGLDGYKWLVLISLTFC